MTIAILKKNIPSTGFGYTGGGADTTITINGLQEFAWNTKKTLIKIPFPIDQDTQESDPSVDPNNKVMDLKQISETLVFKGQIEDESGDSAWNKFWKLRAMATTGGELTSLQIGGLTWSSGTIPAFIEAINMTGRSDDTGEISTPLLGVSRLEVSITFYFGDSRFA